MEKVILRFLHDLEFSHKRAENTLLAYRSDLEQFRQIIALKTRHQPQVQDLNPAMLSEYMELLESKAYRPSTIARKWAAVRSFLEYLKANDAGVDPEIGEHVSYSAPERKQPSVLNLVQIETLINAPVGHETPVAMRDGAILSLLYATGMRAGDVVSIRMDQLDMGNGTIAVSDEENGARALGRSIEALERYLKFGRPHLARLPNDPHVFLNQRGKGLSRQGLWLVVKRWAAEVNLGINISPHTLRHSLVHHLLSDGMSRRDVQNKLGLRSPNSIRVFQEQVHKEGGN
jgi:integrase/recombinase XerD